MKKYYAVGQKVCCVVNDEMKKRSVSLSMIGKCGGCGIGLLLPVLRLGHVGNRSAGAWSGPHFKYH